jgi:hypothetical protein
VAVQVEVPDLDGIKMLIEEAVLAVKVTLADVAAPDGAAAEAAVAEKAAVAVMEEEEQVELVFLLDHLI